MLARSVFFPYSLKGYLLRLAAISLVVGVLAAWASTAPMLGVALNSLPYKSLSCTVAVPVPIQGEPEAGIYPSPNRGLLVTVPVGVMPEAAVVNPWMQLVAAVEPLADPASRLIPVGFNESLPVRMLLRIVAPVHVVCSTISAV